MAPSDRSNTLDHGPFDGMTAEQLQWQDAGYQQAITDTVEALRSKRDSDGYSFWGPIHAEFIEQKFGRSG